MSVYDSVVHGLNNRLVWQCSTESLVDHYNNHIGTVHLDVGIGTGFFLDKLNASKIEQLYLVDANQNSLDVSVKRLARFRPHAINCNIIEVASLQKLGEALEGQTIRSIGTNYVIHCLPHGLESAAPFVAWSAKLLAGRGVFFGSTILGDAAKSRLAPRIVSALFQRCGVFGNSNDDLDSLDQLLCRNFKNVDIRMHGCVAVFAASDIRSLKTQ